MGGWGEVMHIVRTHRLEREGSTQMRTIAYKWKGFKVAYVRQKNFFWTTQSQNFSFSAQKKLLHSHLLLCIVNKQQRN